MTDRPLTVREVAQHYAQTPATVYGWLQGGELGHFRLPGGEYRIRAADLAAFDKTGGPQPRPRQPPPTILERVEREFVPSINPGPPEFVYFVRVGARGPIKIGRAQDVQKRLGNLRVANHRPLILLGFMPGNAKLEASLHRRFKRHRISGEWFKATKSLLLLIAQLPK